MSKEGRELPSRYSPHGLEEKWYPLWENNNYFSWQKNQSREDIEAGLKGEKGSFSIVIPPPNVTGSLHLGHALNHTVQDILTRYHRMKGDLSLWVPGTDHAGIATQNVVERRLNAEGKSRHDMSREEFEEKVWEWKAESGGMIVHQQRELGESVDWSYERFTLDEGLSAIVKKVFVQLYREGLIYRGERMINWCPRDRTALSNIEVEYKEQKGHLYHFKYRLAGGGDEYIPVATTRPETILGDEAVAVHPDDERYTDMIGKKVVVPYVNREIPVIADEYVDREFGTGALKITPAHDPNDFEIGRRHNLPVTNILDEGARLNENTGPYEGLSREEARKKIVDDMTDDGLMLDTESIKHSVGHSYRSGAVVEPRVSKQWFVKVKPLAEEAIKAVEEERIRFVPKRWENFYFDWMQNIEDWCISRQLWWGHRIPAYYCDDCKHLEVAESEVSKCPSCGSSNIRQDADVLDTWFSSGLWPFSTLMGKDIPEGKPGEEVKWPEPTEELQLFYPTSVLVTGFDIIFFWVARMIMMGLHFQKEVPFRDVYIHGLVRDATRQKMSKSKGNVVDPLEKMREYGTDAFRFFMISILPEGKDIIYDESRLKGYQAFCNKIWNTARYIWMNQPADYRLPAHPPGELSEADGWIIEEFNRTLEKVNPALENYRFADYASAVYDFIWKAFCDNYIEFSKINLKDGTQAETTRYVLNKVFFNSLKLLHPVMPFITEELHSFWQAETDEDSDYLIVSDWPQALEGASTEAWQKTERALSAIYSIRRLRGELELPPAEKFKAVLQVSEPALVDEMKNHADVIVSLSRLSTLEVGSETAAGVKIILDFGTIYLDAGDFIDKDKEKKRIGKELQGIEKGLRATAGKLKNEKFIENAPPELVEAEKEKQAGYEAKIKELQAILDSLD